MPCGPHEVFGSAIATVSTASPRAMRGRSARRCSSVAASITVRAPSTPELKNGPGNGPRPSSSYSTAASVALLSPPPYSDGIRMPSHPASHAFRQSGGTSPESERCSATIVWGGASRSMKVRADDFNISWGSVSARSTSASLERRFALLAPGLVPFDLVLGELEGGETIEVDERGIGLVRDVEAPQERFLGEACRERRQRREVRRDLQRLVHQLGV